MARMAKKSRKAAAKTPDSADSAKPEDSPAPRAAAPQKTAQAEAQVPVVGIGASAGGLEALQEFFKALPDEPGMAFVVILHLDPTRTSLLAELLDRQTKMKVVQVDDEPQIAANRVYVTPPGKYLGIAGGRLHLSEPDRPCGARAAIDYFLRSLAEDQQQRAIAIILSGTGADGSLGVKAVKSHGGMVIAQDPGAAAHEGMPSSAIATGTVDHIRRPGEMPNVLLRYAEHLYVREAVEEAADDTAAIRADKTTATQVVRQLEYELAATKEDLQSTIGQVATANEELKASNEEAMSINEELQSANEELEASQEELQSLNEELTAVNSQLTFKVEEVETKHADLQNLIAATDVATICLDNQLRIRWFTPAAQKLVRLEEADLGRPLSDLAHDFVDDDLVEVAQAVLQNLSPVRSEVRCRDHRYFLRRITPYRTEDDRIGGVVVTLVEITERKQAEEALRHSEQQLQFVIDSLPAAVMYIDQNSRYRYFNRRLCEWFELAPSDVQGSTVKEVLGGSAYEAVRPKMEEALGGQLVRYEAELPNHHGGTRYVEVMYTPDVLPDGVVDGYIALMQDITPRKQAELQLKTLNESLEEQVATRVKTLSVLQDIVVAANEAKTVPSALEATLRRICDFNQWAIGHAWLASHDDGQGSLSSSGVWFVRSEPRKARRSLEQFQQLTAATQVPLDQGFLGQAATEGAPLWLDDAREVSDSQRGDLSQFGLRTALVIPVRIAGETLAILELFADHQLRREEQLLEIAPAIGLQLAHCMERKRLEREIAEATAELQRHWGRELHDSVQQELTGISMIAQSLRTSLDEQSSPFAMRLGELVKHLQNAQDQVRRLSRGLMPVEVDAHGLRAALEELCESCSVLYSVPCEFYYPQPVAVENSDTAMHAYRIAQEAIQNAIKHAQPTRIDVSLLLEGDRIVLTISDNGGGFKQPAKSRRGTGQRIMQYRANLIGADLDIESHPGQGVVVTCSMRRKS